jgi:hypothetical protein
VIVDAYGSETIAQDADAFSFIYGLPRISSENFQIVKAPGLVNNPKGTARSWKQRSSMRWCRNFTLVSERSEKARALTVRAFLLLILPRDGRSAS